MSQSVSLVHALRERLGEERVAYSNGSNYTSSTDESIEAALSAANDADIIIAAVGDNSHIFYGVGWGENKDDLRQITSGEGFDDASLDLPPAQQKLLDALAKTGKPIIVVVMAGRPRVIGNPEAFSSILHAWYPGEEGGHVLAQILLGDISPSGRLPISFPRSAGHIPCCYDYKPSARGIGRKAGTPDDPGGAYLFSSPDPLYPFGYGLSYTEFSYSDLRVEPAQVAVSSATSASGDIAKVRVKVANTGKCASDEVALLFVSDDVCSVTPFVRRLRGFERITLEPGEEREIVFGLDFNDLSFIDENMKKAVEPGTFTIAVGSLKTAFELIR
jgi:beta-glucosidase